MANNSPSAHHRTTLSGCIFATKAHIDNRKNVFKQQYLPHMFLQYGELRPTSGWDRFVSLGHPGEFQWVLRLGSVTARHSTSECQPNFAALNRGRHLYLAGRPSSWALAHILVLICYSNTVPVSGGRLKLALPTPPTRPSACHVTNVDRRLRPATNCLITSSRRVTRWDLTQSRRPRRPRPQTGTERSRPGRNRTFWL